MDARENLSLERVAAQLAVAVARIETLERTVAEQDGRIAALGERIAAANEKADFLLEQDD